MIRKCIVCGLSFSTKYSGKKICGEQCKAIHLKNENHKKYLKIKEKRNKALTDGEPFGENYVFDVQRERVATTRERLEELMEELNLGQTGLAVACQVPLTTIKNMLNLEIEEFSVPTLVEISRHTGYSIDWLVGMEE